MNKLTNELGLVSFEESSSGKWISRPQKFMTYKPQNRKGNLALTVYGYPQSFQGISGSLEIKKDQDSYSRFAVDDKNQMNEAIQVIRKARNLWIIKHPG